MTGKHVALLRGINVGRNKKVDMAGLRTIAEELGCTEVKTVLNSGNVVFTADRAPQAAAFETAIRKRYDFEVAVVLRSAADLRRILAANPFEKQASDPSRYFVTFLDRTPPAAALAGLDPATFAPELLHVGNRELYSWLPHGSTDSVLMKQLTNTRLGVTATTRNWNTVTKLTALCED